MTDMLSVLVEAPSRFQKYIDSCTCGRADKAAISSIKMELEAKDSAIERLEEEIRRKDTEKDNLIHMQKDLQQQIEEIRRVLETHAGDSMKQISMDSDKAAQLMQNRSRGIAARKRVDAIRQQKGKGSPDSKAITRLQAAERGKRGRQHVDEKQRSAQLMQARMRGKSARRVVEQRAAKGELPAQRAGRLGAVGANPAAPLSAPPPPASAALPPPSGAAQQPVAIGRVVASSPPYGPTGGADLGDQGGSGSEGSTGRDYEYEDSLGEGGGLYGEDESVDSDYDYDDEEFRELGLELLAGKLKLAKVYTKAGEEEPPAAEDELEWEMRYFVLYGSRKMCHFDEMVDGLPVGDRGLIDLDTITSVEKVLGVPTFVMKGQGKVYLFKLDPHDEVMMRTWIAAISQELAGDS